jgi:hypothetical protein
VRFVSVLSLSMLLALSACPPRTAIWVAPGARVGDLKFMTSDVPGGSDAVSVGFVVVLPCHGAKGDIVWAITNEQNLRPYPREFRYGSEPPGFVTTVQPVPLLPGCYGAMTNGAGTRFMVHDDETIVETRTDAASTS